MITLTIFLSKIPTFTAKSVLKMKGDDFNIIYERNYRRSFLFTKSYVHDDMVAEDIVAESCKILATGLCWRKRDNRSLIAHDFEK